MNKKFRGNTITTCECTRLTDELIFSANEPAKGIYARENTRNKNSSSGRIGCLFINQEDPDSNHGAAGAGFFLADFLPFMDSTIL